MNRRLNKSERRADILEKARELIAGRGFSGTEMEDIRLACGLSRGGLYHHFANKRAILHGLIEDDIRKIAGVLTDHATAPIPALLRAGSAALGHDRGILKGLLSKEDKLDYLAALDEAFDTVLRDPLAARLRGDVRPGIASAHVAELFLTVNAHINRREILGTWRQEDAARFAATALMALEPLLKSPSGLDPIIAELKEKAVVT
ncbi:helix-turn-helix domain containing protein [Primorskyibacter aestuariivivens]|uniref:TetR/AcrR family transcriptional regulator n=1 Tax=Primorskyibacter aestuariivivens TaxID=1888912 RepID=UPI0023009E38|nr:TetR/AcrR family transcriptional regulator [Primorskyibacter aestuariivivens]MDA7427208.1 helix-turn-helix domain containing protein [Primorskyibacter aestuariivivens]